METFHFCTVYIRCATLTLDSAGLDVGVKTIRHVTRYLAPDWFQGAYSFQQAQLPTQAQSWASGAAFARFQPCPSHRATCPSAVSTWHPPQGRGPLPPTSEDPWSYAAWLQTEENPGPTSQRSLPMKVGSLLSQVTNQCEETWLVARKFFMLEFSLHPDLLKVDFCSPLVRRPWASQWIIYCAFWFMKTLLCTELLQGLGERESSGWRSGCVWEQSCVAQGCSPCSRPSLLSALQNEAEGERSELSLF